MTVAEFLTWDDGTDTRYELVDGRITAMAPPSRAHSTIAPNIAGMLYGRLAPPCRVRAEWGIMRADDEGSYWQADLAVVCGEIEPRASPPDPILIVEVVSLSSIDHDRGRKTLAYKELPGCQCILLVFATHRRVERWVRDGDRWIVTDHIGESGAIAIEALDLSLDLAEIYEGSGV
jgi:Uma2 family endonuclease